MKSENKTILLNSMYIILGLMCFTIALETISIWINTHLEVSSLLRIGVLMGIVVGILISIVSTLFGNLSGMVYSKITKAKGANKRNEENDMDI